RSRAKPGYFNVGNAQFGGAYAGPECKPYVIECCCSAFISIERGTGVGKPEFGVCQAEIDLDSARLMVEREIEIIHPFTGRCIPGIHICGTEHIVGCSVGADPGMLAFTAPGS